MSRIEAHGHFWLLGEQHLARQIEEEEMAHRREHLENAITLTCGDRDETYGDPVALHTAVATMWTQILGAEVKAHQVALCMAAVKICRAGTSPQKADHYEDGAAYLAIAGECALGG